MHALWSSKLGRLLAMQGKTPASTRPVSWAYSSRRSGLQRASGWTPQATGDGETCPADPMAADGARCGLASGRSAPYLQAAAPDRHQWTSASGLPGSSPEVCNFQLSKLCNFRLTLTDVESGATPAQTGGATNDLDKLRKLRRGTSVRSRAITALRPNGKLTTKAA